MRVSRIQALSFYDTYRSSVEQELRDVFSSREDFLYDLLRYQLGWVDQRGAPQNTALPLRLHGALALACCEATSGVFQPALPVAAAMELVYNFTLAHGDVQAGRGGVQERPSIWWVWGPAQAINAGDGLHALGHTTLMRLKQRGLPANRVLQAITTLDRACLALCEGQYLDLNFQDQLMVTMGSYFDMIGRKAGALVGCSAELGAMAGGVADVNAASFRELGKCLGMAGQIAEDIGDFWGRSGGMTASNALNKKKGMPLIYALENASLSIKRELGSIYMKRVLEPEDITRIVAILDEAEARQFSENQAKELVERALSAVSDLGLSESGMGKIRDLGQCVLEGVLAGRAA